MLIGMKTSTLKYGLYQPAFRQGSKGFLNHLNLFTLYGVMFQLHAPIPKAPTGCRLPLEISQSFGVSLQDRRAVSKVKTDTSQLSAQEWQELMDKYP